MDDLIKTDKDVTILHMNGIILNGFGNDKEVVDLFNHLSKWVLYFYIPLVATVTLMCAAN